MVIVPLDAPTVYSQEFFDTYTFADLRAWIRNDAHGKYQHWSGMYFEQSRQQGLPEKKRQEYLRLHAFWAKEAELRRDHVLALMDHLTSRYK